MQVCSFISIWLSLFKRKVHLYVAFVILKVGIYACVSQHLKIKSTSSLSPLCRACLIFFSQIRNFCSKQTGKIDCDSRPSHFNDGSLFILISMATQFAGRYLRHLFYWQRAMCVLLPPPLYLTKKCFFMFMMHPSSSGCCKEKLFFLPTSYLVGAQLYKFVAKSPENLMLFTMTATGLLCLCRCRKKFTHVHLFFPSLTKYLYRLKILQKKVK